jgi:DNA-directed RNA polymerase subunit RPC12/RpoP
MRVVYDIARAGDSRRELLAGGGVDPWSAPPYGPRPPRSAPSSPRRFLVARRDSAASRSSSSGRGRGARARTDGKVDIACPQCGAQFRIAGDALDSKIECTECHRVFIAKSTAGKRVAAPDHTKVYVGFGIGAVALIGIFVVMSGGGDAPKAAPPPVVNAHVYGRGDHPRTAMIVKWARAIGDDNRLVMNTHSDLRALATLFALPAGSDDDAVLKAMREHDATRFLRELQCDSGELLGTEDMTAASGKASVFVTAKPGDDTWLAKWNGVLEVSFRMDGEQVKVTGLSVTKPPVRNPKKPDPSKQTFQPVKDIAKPTDVEITDSAGTRKVRESQPAAVPHWDKATPALQKKAEDTVALLLQSADPEAPGTLFNKATMSIQTLDDKKAVVPRVLNAMFELYPDVTTNNIKLSQLDRALRAWTGFGVNYDPADTGDAAKDKAARESCVRQWFAYWYRHGNTQLTDHMETEESLEMPVKKDDKKPAGK